jgi:RNA polymerase sigma-70 factor (ECF subfamily)
MEAAGGEARKGRVAPRLDPPYDRGLPLVPVLPRSPSRATPASHLSVVRSPAEGAVADTDAPATESDASLVAGTLAGRARSKEALYRKHVGYIAGMCARLLRSVDAGEDVTQDAFVLAFQRLASLREPEAFRGWLATIAVREVRRHLSRERLRVFLGFDRALDDAPLDELAREDLSIEARSELAALDVVLQQLPAGVRLAWMLRYVEDEPLELIAQACECSLATAKRRIATADVYVRQHVSLGGEGAAS